MLKLNGKIVLVTGGSMGIGKAIAKAFALEGAKVAIAARTFSEVNNTAAELQTLGTEILPLTADVSKVQDIKKMVTAVIEAYGRIDVLVNCAGVFGPIGPLVENDIDQWIEAININLMGTVFCCKTVLPHMIAQRSGKIINLSGGGAANPHPNFSAYGTSKAAVVRFTETIAEEVKTFGVQVNVMAPGGVNTRLQDEVLFAGESAGLDGLAKARKIKENGGTPLSTPAALAVFLASSDSDGLTGKLISAVWDDWQNFGKNIIKIASSDIYTLRRITDF